MFVVSAPSGGGKGTILEALAGTGATMQCSVSATTRKPRLAEKDGVDYRFVDRQQFEKWIEQDKFVEWAEVHGQLYGTLKEELERKRGSGESVILELDVQGMRNVKETGRAAVLFDRYNDDWSRIGWVLVRGTASLLDGGREHSRAINLLRSRYPQYQTMSLETLPIIAVRANRCTSWGNIEEPRPSPSRRNWS